MRCDAFVRDAGRTPPEAPDHRTPRGRCSAGVMTPTSASSPRGHTGQSTASARRAGRRGVDRTGRRVHPGTFEEPEDGPEWLPLPSHAVPLDPGAVLLLGNQLMLRFDVLIKPAGGGTTPGRTNMIARGCPGSGVEHLRWSQPLCWRLAARARSPQSFPTPPKSPGRLGCHVQTVYRRLEDLRENRPVKRMLRGRDLRSTADAVAAAYPYLLTGRPKDPNDARSQPTASN